MRPISIASLLSTLILVFPAVAQDATLEGRPDVRVGIVAQQKLQRITLVRYGQYRLALILKKEVPPKRGWQGRGVQYEWYLAADGSTDFSKANVRQGTGVVYDYRRNWPEMPAGENMMNVNLDAPRTISCGPVSLRWYQGNWLVLPLSQREQARQAPAIAITNQTQLKEVQWDSKDLVWITPLSETNKSPDRKAEPENESSDRPR